MLGGAPLYDFESAGYQTKTSSGRFLPSLPLWPATLMIAWPTWYPPQSFACANPDRPTDNGTDVAKQATLSILRSIGISWTKLLKRRSLWPKIETPVGGGNRHVRANARTCAQRRFEADSLHDRRRQITAIFRATGASGERTAGFLEEDCRLPEARRKHRPALGEGGATRPSACA